MSSNCQFPIMNTIRLKNTFSKIESDILYILYQNHNYYLDNSDLLYLEQKNRFEHRNRAAKIIQKAWRTYSDKKIYKLLKNKLHSLSLLDPQIALRPVNPTEARYLDRGCGQVLVFRLDGTRFPPKIVYKIFAGFKIIGLYNRTKQKMCDVKFREEESMTCNRGWKSFFEYKTFRIKRCSDGKRIRTADSVGTNRRGRNMVLKWISEKYGV